MRLWFDIHIHVNGQSKCLMCVPSMCPYCTPNKAGQGRGCQNPRGLSPAAWAAAPLTPAVQYRQYHFLSTPCSGKGHGAPQSSQSTVRSAFLGDLQQSFLKLPQVNLMCFKIPIFNSLRAKVPFYSKYLAMLPLLFWSDIHNITCLNINSNKSIQWFTVCGTCSTLLRWNAQVSETPACT